MLGLIFKIFGAAACLVLLVYAAANALRSKRCLDAKIRQFKAEQEAQKNRPGALDPYAALAELYAEQTVPEPKRRAPGRRR